MNMPNSYKETKATGEFTPIQLGGHHLIIKKVFEKNNEGNPIVNKYNQPMIIVCFDMADNDVQPKYATNEVLANKEKYGKFPYWVHSCTAYITTEKDGVCTKQFKTFTTCYAHSNGIDTDAIKWGDGFCDQFTGKRIGGVFGEVESEYEGRRFMKHDLRWFCSDDKVDGATIPDAKRLDGSTQPGNATPGNGEFMKIPDNVSDFVPFG